MKTAKRADLVENDGEVGLVLGFRPTHLVTFGTDLTAKPNVTQIDLVYNLAMADARSRRLTLYPQHETFQQITSKYFF